MEGGNIQVIFFTSQCFKSENIQHLFHCWFAAFNGLVIKPYIDEKNFSYFTFSCIGHFYLKIPCAGGIRQCLLRQLSREADYQILFYKEVYLGTA